MSRLLNVVMYHYTRDLKHSRYPDIKALDIGLFRKQIEYFLHNYTIVTMEKVVEAVVTGIDLPENAMLLTFDDGYIDNYTYVFPVLNEYKIQGSFYIPGKTFTEHALLDVNKIHLILATSRGDVLYKELCERLDFYRGNEFDIPSNKELYETYAVANRFDTKETIFVKRVLQNAIPERLRNIISSELFEKYVGISEETMAYELYMSEDQIKTLKRYGMHIGVHGYDHYWLGKLTSEQMKEDISKALDVMDCFIDKTCWSMNYPYGNYSDAVMDYVKSKGAVVGFSTEVRMADLKEDNVLCLPRFDCNDFLCYV